MVQITEPQTESTLIEQSFQLKINTRNLLILVQQAPQNKPPIVASDISADMQLRSTSFDYERGEMCL